MMQRPDHFKYWPLWAREAQANMESCGLTSEQLIGRALLLGMKVREWGGKSDAVTNYSEHCTHHVNLEDGSGLLAMSMEMAAYRYLKQSHKEILNPP
jgi:hypothetical protein